MYVLEIGRRDKRDSVINTSHASWLFLALWERLFLCCIIFRIKLLKIDGSQISLRIYWMWVYVTDILHKNMHIFTITLHVLRSSWVKNSWPWSQGHILTQSRTPGEVNITEGTGDLEMTLLTLLFNRYPILGSSCHLSIITSHLWFDG